MSEPPESPEPSWTAARRYLPLRILGSGAGGTVWLAEDRELGREVAVKELSRRLETSPWLERFDREAKITAGIHHPHVVRLFDHGVGEGGRPFLVFEVLRGGSLAERLEAGMPLEVPEALRVARELAGAVAALHEAGVLHRDIKPANILLREDGSAVLADLGLAFTEADPSILTATGEVLGTPHYMAPERWVGEVAGPASDQFSLAATILRFAFGVRAYPEGAVAEMGRWIRDHDRVEVPAREGIPASFRDAVEKALAFDPAARFESVEAFGAALRRSELARGSPPAPAARRDLRGLLAIAGASLLSLAVLAGTRAAPPPAAGPPRVAANPAPEEPPAAVLALEEAVDSLIHLLEEEGPFFVRGPRHVEARRESLLDPRLPVAFRRVLVALEGIVATGSSTEEAHGLALEGAGWIRHVLEDVAELRPGERASVAKVAANLEVLGRRRELEEVVVRSVDALLPLASRGVRSALIVVALLAEHSRRDLPPGVYELALVMLEDAGLAGPRSLRILVAGGLLRELVRVGGGEDALAVTDRVADAIFEGFPRSFRRLEVDLVGAWLSARVLLHAAGRLPPGDPRLGAAFELLRSRTQGPRRKVASHWVAQAREVLGTGGDPVLRARLVALGEELSR